MNVLPYIDIYSTGPLFQEILWERLERTKEPGDGEEWYKLPGYKNMGFMTMKPVVVTCKRPAEDWSQIHHGSAVFLQQGL